jgi:pimeloyl-ACP methyl ester carboxylesterase
MQLTCQKHYLHSGDIKDRWKVLNPFLGHLNSERIDYKIWSGESEVSPRTGTFYLHGLGGCLDDCPGLEDSICPHTPMIRVSCFGISDPVRTIGLATFGDICAILHNSRQSIYTIADHLELVSYNVVAHSWGGFVACIATLNDTRCKKAMLLCSTPDICDALSQMYQFARLPGLLHPVADVLMGKLRIEAENAKYGRSRHQRAWEQISPYGEINNPGIRMLIFNRAEDLVMRRWNVEHFVEHARQRGIKRVTAEFNTYPELSDWHDMPPEKFTDRMRDFLFGKGGVLMVTA